MNINWKNKKISESKDRTANIYTVRCFFGFMGVYTVALFFNIIGMFIIEQSIFIPGYLLALGVSFVFFCLLFSLGLGHPLIKYISITAYSIIITIAGVTLTYHTVIAVTIPIVLCGIYVNKRLSMYAYILSVISIILVVYLGYYIGICDANMALLTRDTLSNYTENGRFTLTTVNKNPVLTLGLYFVLPRVLIMTAFFQISRNVYRMFEKTISKAIRMETQASIDGMTGLYNKNKLLDVINTSYFKDNQIAVICWDVNELKFVNDTYGHIEGDTLIVNVAETIKAVTDEKSFGYRYGGDEFIVIIKDGTKEIAETKIKKWKEAIKKLTENQELPISASVGYAVGEGECLEEIIQHADENMYLNKSKAKRNRQY